MSGMGHSAHFKESSRLLVRAVFERFDNNWSPRCVVEGSLILTKLEYSECAETLRIAECVGLTDSTTHRQSRHVGAGRPVTLVLDSADRAGDRT